MEKTTLKKASLKKDIENLFKSMDFISENFLSKEDISKKEMQIYFNIYQQLSIVWELLGLQCKHWEGFKKTKDKKEVCKICGKVKGVDNLYYLFPIKGVKQLGIKLKPNSKKTFETKKEAQIVSDVINFYGALVNVEVFNSYKSNLLGNKISIAGDRIVKVQEDGVECQIDRNLVKIELNKAKKKKRKPPYGGFPWEIKKEKLKNFPVIFEYDDDYRFLGLTIFK